MARYLAALAESEFSATAQLIDLAELPPGFISGEMYGAKTRHTDFERLAAQLSQNARTVWVFPEYNNSYPGVLKAFLDSFPFPNPMQGGRAALVGVSAGTNGGANAMSHMADVLSYLGIWLVPQRLRVASVMKELDAEGRLTTPALQGIAKGMLGQLLS